jgi:hypothetical protein
MQNNKKIDINYDFRSDANGKDPDKYSATLRQYHQILWSKPLPRGKVFKLNSSIEGVYLHHKSQLGEFFLSSDSVIPTYIKWKRLSHIIDQITQVEKDEFLHTAYTIGGMMVFPSNTVNGKPTINSERGFNAQIADRLDLTLECIRLYYLGKNSPMGETLTRYDNFLKLFGNFKGYIDYFSLNDLATEDYNAIKFFTPFNNFESSSLPSSLQEYILYREASIKFVNARNQRIAKSIEQIIL